MTANKKILTLSLGFLTTLFIFVEAGHHGNGNELTTLIAAALITLMLKEGSASRNSLSLARHAHGLTFPAPHGMSLEGFTHPRTMGEFGYHAFNFAPMFGGLRYHLANLDHIPLPGPDFGKAMDFPLSLGRNYGLYPPLPNMLPSSRQVELNNHFDIVRNILQREREHNPPHNMETQNNPHFNPQNREFLNFDQGNKPPAELRKHDMN